MPEIKLVLVGVGGVGKSALAIRYVSQVWVPEYDPTIEDSHRKQVTVDSEEFVLDILDTAGQEEYTIMQDQWFRKGQGFLMVYSITSKKSFAGMPALRDKICACKESQKVPMVLVANKSDLEEGREVAQSEGEDLAKEFGCPFLETSAKNNDNVDNAFASLVREWMRIIREGGKAVKPKKKMCILL